MTGNDFYVGQEVYIISDRSNQKWIVTNADSPNEGGCYVFRHVESLGEGKISLKFVRYSDLITTTMKTSEKELDLGSIVILKSDCRKYEDQRSYWTVESRNDRTGDCTLVQINTYGEFKRIVVNEKALQVV